MAGTVCRGNVLPLDRIDVDAVAPAEPLLDGRPIFLAGPVRKHFGDQVLLCTLSRLMDMTTTPRPSTSCCPRRIPRSSALGLASCRASGRSWYDDAAHASCTDAPKLPGFWGKCAVERPAQVASDDASAVSFSEGKLTAVGTPRQVATQTSRSEERVVSRFIRHEFSEESIDFRRHLNTWQRVDWNDRDRSTGRTRPQELSSGASFAATIPNAQNRYHSSSNSYSAGASPRDSTIVGLDIFVPSGSIFSNCTSNRQSAPKSY